MHEHVRTPLRRSLTTLGLAGLASLAACYSGYEGRDVGDYDRGGATPGRWQLTPEVANHSQQVSVAIHGSPGGSHKPSNCTGNFTPGAQILEDYIRDHFDGVEYIGGYSCRPISHKPENPTSIHGLGRALDIHMGCPTCAANNADGDILAHWLILHAEEIGIQRIIWDLSSWSSTGMSQTRPYNGAHSHNDHLHVEINLPAAAMQTPWFTEQGYEPPPDLPDGPLDPCGDVDEVGRCDGNTLVRCDDDTYLRVQDCGPDATCGTHPAVPHRICKTTSRKDLVALPDGSGYWLTAADGGVFALGDAPFHGSVPGLPDLQLAARVVGMAADASRGYWLVAEDGGVFAFGGVGFYGSMAGQPIGAPVVGIEATPNGDGYWLVSEDGGIFAFGGAGFHGSLPGIPDLHLAAPIVAMASTRAGNGYWLVGADGGLFGFNAPFHGSLPGNFGSIDSEIVDLAASVDGGYWMAAADGRVFAFGPADNHGGVQHLPLAAPIVGIEASPSGRGYWLVGADGGVFSLGDAAFHGTALEDAPQPND